MTTATSIVTTPTITDTTASASTGHVVLSSDQLSALMSAVNAGIVSMEARMEKRMDDLKRELQYNQELVAMWREWRRKLSWRSRILSGSKIMMIGVYHLLYSIAL